MSRILTAAPRPTLRCITCGDTGLWEPGKPCYCLMGGILAAIYRPNPRAFLKIVGA